MMDLLIKSSVRRKIVAIFVFNKDRELYSAQVAKEINELPYAVGLELQHLTKGGLLNSSREGRQIYYRWNNDYRYARILEETINEMRNEGNKEICGTPSLSRREEIDKNLERIVKDIIKFYQPEKIILFGSASSGKTNPYSDIDLVTIKKTDLPYFKRIQQLIDMLDYNIDVDFFVYTPEEFKRESKDNLFFKNEIIKKGKILYEKAA